jgi:hypothetical protein
VVRAQASFARVSTNTLTKRPCAAFANWCTSQLLRRRLDQGRICAVVVCGEARDACVRNLKNLVDEIFAGRSASSDLQLLSRYHPHKTRRATTPRFPLGSHSRHHRTQGHAAGTMMASMHVQALASGVRGDVTRTRRISRKSFFRGRVVMPPSSVRHKRTHHVPPRAAAGEESFLDKINPFKKKSAELVKRASDDKNATALINDDTRKQLFGDGLLGRAVSGLINKAASGAQEQMRSAAEASEVTYDAAVRATRIDSRVRNALGNDFSATPPMSQMSSSANINGVSSQQTSISFLLQSTTGRRAQVQAVSTTMNGVTTVDATVATDGGEQFVIKDCAGGADAVMADASVYGGASGRSDRGYSDPGATIDIDADDVIDV